MAKKSNYYCCVPQCDSWIKRDSNLSFHSFPKKDKQDRVLFNGTLVNKRNLWKHLLKMGKEPSPYMKVCSLHFKNEDYFKGENLSKLRRLKRCAIPSCKLPKVNILSKELPTNSTRAERSKNRTKQKVNPECDPEPPSIPDVDVPNKTNEPSEEDILCVDALLQLSGGTVKSFKDFQVQVNTPKVVTLSDIITSDTMLCSFTGLQNFQLLDGIVSSVNLVYKDIRSHRLGVRQRIILTFIKLKLDLSYAVLAPLFGVTQGLCKTYITQMICILAEVLQCTIYMPSSAELQKNVPICFTNFEDTEMVLDCTEIKVYKPKCLCCRIRFYSQYKGSETIKFMTGVSPSGVITFVSRPYGGRASDKIIFEESGVIEQIKPGSAIMVDKGFLIDELCSFHNVKLYRPPFLEKRKQLSREEAIQNSDIAAARVHIERTNQRIKLFKILSNKLHTNFIPYIQNIFIIICAVTNLSSPILADNKFLQ
ncbi:uncharacterized protein [Diabrotica undecimpunctata]|uniref:uncharacterized protein n=1 Tax=Diabrotica undecimpunctata TaxID=50387 RepID=UPI003B63AA80